MTTLYDPLKVGAWALSHRVVMAPLTRMRAARPGNIPTPLMAEYYAQRASEGGLIISEATQVVPEGQGMPATPGIHSAAQVEGWRAVTDAVHDKGGLIVCQLWHVGRISHSSVQPDGGLPKAPSAIAPPSGMALTADFERVPFETPEAIPTEALPVLVEAYAQAARNALAADFDGVEIHSANGYLLEQFMQSASNQRTDRYGGSIENRCRLPLEVTEAIVAAIGGDRVGIRLSPFGVANGSGEPDPMPLYTHLVEKLAPLGLAYVHFIEPRASGAGQAEVDHQDTPSAADLFRPLWPGVLITAGNFTRESAEGVVERGAADAVAFGRHFIANPDLPKRLKQAAPLNPYNRATFYGGGAEGYTDYPAL
ncbi:alkene reductase [Acuticoccus mangrovi]|uniref:Alkene reductase n=1 Tax=Acuticoccus mangrovi TaxID=2796142 RepID=A0A934IDQ6_9HYPH|nr:alkene reductase [Acuticoccus mangrovi]MBJ3774679.1 alkene reductase [Acuticoccus mangrovi]